MRRQWMRAVSVLPMMLLVPAGAVSTSSADSNPLDRPSDPGWTAPVEDAGPAQHDALLALGAGRPPAGERASISDPQATPEEAAAAAEVMADGAAAARPTTSDEPGVRASGGEAANGAAPAHEVTEDVTLPIEGPPPPVKVNLAPSVWAGADVATEPGVAANLVGVAADVDGDVLSIEWSLVPDPARPATATCSFGQPTSTVTPVTCTEIGSYVVALSADDGLHPPVVDTAVITVAAPPPPPPPGTCENAVEVDLEVDGFLGNQDGHRVSRPVEVSLPCGLYQVVLVSGDSGHAAGYQPSQTEERWFLEGLEADGAMAYRSPPTADLAEDVTTARFEVDLADLRGVVQLRAWHAGLGPDVSSLHELSVILFPFKEP